MTDYNDEASRTDQAKAAANDAAAKAKEQADNAKRAAQEKANQFKAKAGNGDAQAKAKAAANDASAKAKKAAGQAASKAGETVHKNRDKINAGIDKAATLADQKTNGKATGIIEQVKKVVHKVLDQTEKQRTTGTKVADAADDVSSRVDDAATTTGEKLDGDNRF